MEYLNSGDEAAAKEKILQERIQNTAWTQEELLFRNRWKHVRPKLYNSKVPLSLALKILYRRSIFGEYLDEFNHQQHQNQYLNTNKLSMTMYDQKMFSEADWKYFRENNDDFLLKDSMSYLKNVVAKLDLINLTYFQEKMNCIRMNNWFINELDDGFYDYKQLKIIHLNGNWINRIPGEVFPRCLQWLNLFANNIEAFDSGIDKLPKISLLGLGRNSLHDHSQLHLLSHAQSLQGLRSLDLSHNEICDLNHLLTCINGLKHLTSLELEGSPCYVCPSYKDDILKNIPQLLYLDNVEILGKDRVFSTENISEQEAAIIFSCHRIFGLPPPPKQKGVTQTIHLEISLPLLEEVVIPKKEPEIVVEEPISTEIIQHKTIGKKGKEKSRKDKSKHKIKPTKKKSSKTKSSKTKSSKTKSSKKKNKRKEKGNLFYNAEDEYENEKKAGVANTAFCTEHVPWSKLIQFPEEAIIIKSQELNNVTAIRDTFKTRVNVKVVYLKVEIPQKIKKRAGKSKGSVKKGKKAGKKKKSKSGKSSKGKAANIVDKVVQNRPQNESEEKPKENILKKITLASFNCNLYPVSWSDKTIDFYWALHDDCKTEAICVNGSLRAIKYEDPNKKGKKKPFKPPKASKASKKASKASKKPSKASKRTKGSKSKENVAKLLKLKDEAQSCPNIFTVQVGFGLKRCYEI